MYTLVQTNLGPYYFSFDDFSFSQLLKIYSFQMPPKSCCQIYLLVSPKLYITLIISMESPSIQIKKRLLLHPAELNFILSLQCSPQLFFQKPRWQQTVTTFSSSDHRFILFRSPHSFQVYKTLSDRNEVKPLPSLSNTPNLPLLALPLHRGQILKNITL